MSTKKLTDERRRALTLAALSGGSPTALAREYGVTRDYVYKLKRGAEREAEAEAEFWGKALRLIHQRDPR